MSSTSLPMMSHSRRYRSGHCGSCPTVLQLSVLIYYNCVVVVVVGTFPNIILRKCVRFNHRSQSLKVLGRWGCSVQRLRNFSRCAGDFWSVDCFISPFCFDWRLFFFVVACDGVPEESVRHLGWRPITMLWTTINSNRNLSDTLGHSGNGQHSTTGPFEFLKETIWDCNF